MLPWAVFFLGLRPVIAYNIGCCTFRWVIFTLGLHPVIALTRGYCTLLWVIFLLGLRPVFACNIGCCTLHWVISLSGLRLVLAYNIGCCTFRRVIFHWGFAPSLLKCNLPNYLQLRPAFARNICCTISWTMFLLRLHAVLAQMYPPKLLQICPSLFPLKRATCGDAIRSGRTFCVRTNCDDLYEEIFLLPPLIVTQSSSWQCFPTF